MAKEQQAVENKPVETQEMINALVEKADVALRKYMEMDQEAVDRIVQAMALAALEQHMKLAKLAYEETGRGIYEDKITKNLFASEYIYQDRKSVV